MELKSKNGKVTINGFLSSNRTFMELKCNQGEAGNGKAFRSNRTFMELKSAYHTRRQQRHSCSNRTFMELKFKINNYISFFQSVLIVPLWNWNNWAAWERALPKICSNRTFMELKWETEERLRLKCARSNRTFMELKCTICGWFVGNHRVLIVPLWNWNHNWLRYNIAADCSNRTFMELKFIARTSATDDYAF